MPKPFRLAEQYLIRAEAYCQKNDFSKAGNDLSTLRKMRYKSGGTINVTKDNWLQTISDERLRELYMEGFRLHDLKRWHKASSVSRRPIPRPKAARSRSKPTTRFSYGRSRSTSWKPPARRYSRTKATDSNNE